ncbi:hypothetical protein LCGC14_2912560, partial [marine sediment metagenome]
PEQPDESAETTSPSAPGEIFSEFADDPDLADIIEEGGFIPRELGKRNQENLPF